MWQTLLLESGLGRVEGSSRRNGGSMKGTPRSDVIYQVSGGIDFLGKQRMFLPGPLCFNHTAVYYIGKKLHTGGRGSHMTNLDNGF